MTSPVVEEWVGNETVLSRGGVGRLVLAPNEFLGRADLVTNEEVLVPLLKHCGLRVTVAQIVEHVELFLNYARPKGKPNLPRKACRFQAWKLKRLVSVFSRVAKRGHYPRERGIRRIFTGAGIPLPSDPRDSRDSLQVDTEGEDEGEESERVSDTEFELESGESSVGKAAHREGDRDHLAKEADSNLREETASAASNVTPLPNHSRLETNPPSAEKLQKHAVELLEDGTGTCRKCGLFAPSRLCPNIQSLFSRPCTGQDDGKDLKFQILFSNDWLKEFQSLVKNLKFDEWQVMAHSGKSFRFLGNGKLSEIPEPCDFPLMLQPIPAEQLQAELELALLEVDLLNEQLQLEELEYALHFEEVTAEPTKKLEQNNIMPEPFCAGDNFDTLPFDAHMAMESFVMPPEAPLPQEKPKTFAEMSGAGLSSETLVLGAESGEPKVEEPEKAPKVEGSEVVEPGKAPKVEGSEVVEPGKAPKVEGSEVVEPNKAPKVEESKNEPAISRLPEGINPAVVRTLMDAGYTLDTAIHMCMANPANPFEAEAAKANNNKGSPPEDWKDAKAKEQSKEKKEQEKGEARDDDHEQNEKDCAKGEAAPENAAKAESGEKEEEPKEEEEEVPLKGAVGRPAALDAIPILAPQEQAPRKKKSDKKEKKGAKGRGRGKKNGKGKGKKARESGSDDEAEENDSCSGEESNAGDSDDHESVEEPPPEPKESKKSKKEKTSKKTAKAKAMAKQKARTKESKKNQQAKTQKNKTQNDEAEEAKEDEAQEKNEKPKRRKRVRPETKTDKKEKQEKTKKPEEKDKKKMRQTKPDQDDEEEKGKALARKRKSVQAKVDAKEEAEETEEPSKPKRSKKESGRKAAHEKNGKDSSENQDEEADEKEAEKLETKAKQSRKSSAYHTAKRAALKEGHTKEEALEIAKEAYRNTK